MSSNRRSPSTDSIRSARIPGRSEGRESRRNSLGATAVATCASSAIVIATRGSFMGAMTEVKVPDIGDFTDVPIIEVMVKAGDRVAAEDSLIALESDKATMEVPAPAAGTVKEVKVKVGDKVSDGTLILLLDSEAGTAAAASEMPKERVSPPPSPTSTPGGIAEVRVPDIGDFKDVPVIEILVKPGDSVKA